MALSVAVQGLLDTTPGVGADKLANKHWETALMAQKIRELRRLRGLTQKQLADSVGIADATIRGYELQRSSPKAEHITKMAEALGVRPECLKIYDLGYWDSYTANALFQLADVYGLAPRACADYVCLEPTNRFLADMLSDWTGHYEALKNGDISQRDYQLWKDCYAADYKPEDFPKRYERDEDGRLVLISPWESRRFAAKLREQRGARDMTQDEFSRLIEIKMGVYRSYEQGRRLPKVSIIGDIATKLGITPASLRFIDFGTPIQAAHVLFQIAGSYNLRPDIVNDAPILRSQLFNLEKIIDDWSIEYQHCVDSGNSGAYISWQDRYDPDSIDFPAQRDTRYTGTLRADGTIEPGFSDYDPYDPRYPHGFLKA